MSEWMNEWGESIHVTWLCEHMFHSSVLSLTRHLIMQIFSFARKISAECVTKLAHRIEWRTHPLMSRTIHHLPLAHRCNVLSLARSRQRESSDICFVRRAQTVQCSRCTWCSAAHRYTRIHHAQITNNWVATACTRLCSCMKYFMIFIECGTCCQGIHDAPQHLRETEEKWWIPVGT